MNLYRNNNIYSDDDDLEDDEDDDKTMNKSKGHWTKEVCLSWPVSSSFASLHNYRRTTHYGG